MFYILPNIKNNIDNTDKGERMFFIVGMSTFTWILVAYIGLHIGAEHPSSFKRNYPRLYSSKL